MVSGKGKDGENRGDPGMKGIIRAGGYGTRLYPSTRAVNKHFFPVYDKPVVYYPLSLLIMTGVTKILLVVFPKDRQAYFDLLGDGSSFGVSISYQIQSEPVGLPESLMECRDFIGSESIVVALGDNVFFGEHLRRDIQGAAERFQKRKGATVFCKSVEDPRDFGVLEYGSDGRICSIEHNPRNPKSNYAVTGLFFFDADVFDTISRTETAEDGSVVFVQLLRQYLKEGRLYAEKLDESVRWFDTGTPERLYLASRAVREYQRNFGACTGSIEEAAFNAGLIDTDRLLALAAELKPAAYGRYLEEYALKAVIRHIKL